MKTTTLLFKVIVCVFPLSCFAQQTEQVIAHAKTGKAQLRYDTKPTDELVIDSYAVEEVINMPFGKRTTKYEVSKLDMINTYDLGPNNTRTVTPIYRKTKPTADEVDLQGKKTIDSVPAAVIKPVKIDVAHVKEAPKYIDIDISGTYEKVLSKGYKSADMLKKVADKAYFEGDMNDAAKYYADLLKMKVDLDPIYYYRCAEALKSINQMEKANEMMLLFESKNLNNKVAKH